MTDDGNTDSSLDQLLAAPPRVAEPLGAGPIVLYGAGNKGRDVLRLLREAGHDVVACIDRRGAGEIDGVPVVSATDPEVGRLARTGATAVVSIFDTAVDSGAISEALTAAGFRRVVSIVELRQLLHVPETYWCGSEAEMTPPPGEAEWLDGRLADDQIREILRQSVALRRTWDPRWMRDVVTDDQFVPAGVPISRENLRFVDGGAFDGDTIALLANIICTFSAVAAFEPDPANFLAMGKRLAALGPCREMSLWPCGLGSGVGQVQFQGGGGHVEQDQRRRRHGDPDRRPRRGAPGIRTDVRQARHRRRGGSGPRRDGEDLGRIAAHACRLPLPQAGRPVGSSPARRSAHARVQFLLSVAWLEPF